MFHAYQRIDKRRKTIYNQRSTLTHFGEKNTLEKAKNIGLWLGMDNEFKKYVQSCPICQLQKTTRIKNQAKSILPDIPLAPNEKLALDISGPLPEIQKGNRYILSMQDRLTKYTVLVPLQNKSTNSIIEALIDQYIYTFEAPKTILSDQGSNFLSELMTQFENALNIRHINTTAFHPQYGNIERMHSALVNLIKTSITKNNEQWDLNLKYINFLINTTTNQTTGHSPDELSFGRTFNVPSTVNTSPNLSGRESR